MLIGSSHCFKRSLEKAICTAGLAHETSTVNLKGFRFRFFNLKQEKMQTTEQLARRTLLTQRIAKEEISHKQDM